MLEELTPEQEKLLDQVRDEWIAIGLSTEPTDPQEAIEALKDVYVCGELKAPERVYVCGSPYEACVLSAAGKDPTELGGEIQSRLEALSGIEANTGKSAKSDAIYGQHDAGWLSFYDAFKRLGVDDAPELRGLFRYAKAANWAWLGEREAWLSVRPRKIAFDTENNLHSATGAAIEYPDGWGVYCWHGTVIPKEWIVAPGKVDISLALTWPQIEQRRCLAEIVGWDKILNSIPHKVIDTHEDPMIGSLIEADIPDSGLTRFLKVKCGTGRTFCVIVDGAVKTAAEANARSYRINVKDLLRSELRT